MKDLANLIATVLVVDDELMVREPLCLFLELDGHTVVQAEDGLEGLEILSQRAQDFDLILLDMMMPRLNGYETLQRIKADPQLRHLPVVMVSAVDDYKLVARCIAAGAEDYIFKPFDEVMLRARVDASLARKMWHDREVAYRRQIEAEREKADDLLLNILPAPIMKRLKQGQSLIADEFSEVTILFADIANFTAFSADFPPEQTVSLLDGLFSHFDDLVQQAGLEKIKTIGDAYLVAGGLPVERSDHAQAVADLALAMQAVVSDFQWPNGESVQMRSGIDVGPVVAGVIGKKKFAYDIWGDVVNTANRLQALSMPGYIHVSGSAYARLHDDYVLQKRGKLQVKGKGEMVTYFLQRKRPSAALS